MPSISTAEFDEIRKTTLQAHESPALFESVAEIAGVSEDDEAEDTTHEDGTSINAYGSPLALWELKKGYLTQTPPTKRSLWSRLKWGVCQAVIDELGAEGRRPEGVMLADGDARLSSRADMEISFDLGGTWIPMIAKNVAGRMLDMWRNAVGDWVVPEATIIEAHHHMLVRNATQAYIAVLFSGTAVHHFVVDRDEELIAEIADASQRFWDCVDSNRRPGSTTKADQKVIARLNAIIDPVDEVIDLRGDADIQSMLADKERLKSEEKAIGVQLEEIDAKLRAQMDGKASALVSDTHQLRWIRTAARKVSYETSASAYLRTTKIATKAAGTPLAKLADPSA